MSRDCIGPPYKGDNNSFLTQLLFYDRWVDLPEEARTWNPVFTLHNDRPGLINARTAFIELEDPTGYKFARKYLKSWPHFEKLEQTKWFAEALSEWRYELEMKLKSDAVFKIREIASGDSAQALQAARYLASAEYKKAAHGRGRPSEAELKGELAKAVRALSYEEDDAKRIGLTVITGGKK